MNAADKPREIRELLNLRETEFLNPLACYSENAIRRNPDAHQDSGYRQAFCADADRILNSLAYTRYIDKTQVFSLIRNDHITHRVLHVQMVSRIARTIGRYLGLNEDLIEAASLGHDIGHPPFGHDGERYLSKLTHKHGAGYFHHNLQSIQFLDKIERQAKGWNLSLQTMDAIACHDGEVFNRQLKPSRNRTFEDFDRLMAEGWQKKSLSLIPMTMEGCVVRLADTISYIGRDMEDAVRLDLIKREEIPGQCQAILGSTNGTIVHHLVTDLISTSMRQPFIGFSDPVADALKTLKHFNYTRIYLNPKIKSHLEPVEGIFAHLFERFLKDLETGSTTSPVFCDFLNGMSEEYIDTHTHAQIVRDYISGMTDSYFIDMAPSHMRPGTVTRV
ncbi:MAG: HD domain-containing protein [Desulfobacteraceae bacterium]|nr:MAG: HD domain-containing protein [Desulfobacteraceae bacterium]